MNCNYKSQIPDDFNKDIILDELLITKATPNDIDNIISIEVTSHKNPWSKQSFLNVITNKSNYLHLILIKSIKSNVIIGYICFQYLFKELYLQNVTISESWRAKGIGTKILSFLIDKFKTHGCEKVVLDVDPQNIPAVKLYTKLGFKFVNNLKQESKIMILKV